MRIDRFIENDSGAYSIIPSWVVDDVIEDQRENDVTFVSEHKALLQALVGDDTFIARVVVGEPLTEAEQTEWISRVRWPLDVKCGRLLISGGFDPDTISYLVEEESPFIEVPPGKYCVEVYTYLNTMNGRVLHDQWGPDAALGTWFRHDHPGRPFPTWVASELIWAAEEDPGHEGHWRNLAKAVADGSLEIECGPWSWVGVVVHLLPFEASELELSEPGPEGFFSEDSGLRRPSVFPLGIVSDCPETTVTDEVRQVLEPDE